MDIFECQPGKFYRLTSEYKFTGRRDGLYLFTAADGSCELFSRSRYPHAGWHLKRGVHYYEFCSTLAKEQL